MRSLWLLALMGGLSVTEVTLGAEDDSRRRDDSRDRGDRRGRVTFYQDADFRGGSITLEAGEDIENLALMQFSNGMSANDRISSVRIEGPVEVVVFRDSRYRGASARFVQDVRNLGRDGREWNDLISSIRTESRRPGSARAEQARIDQAIERAFRDVLQRKPDEPALRSYRTRMIEESWTEQQVREALRRSDEYRTVVDRVVAKAYRDILGREGDAGGMRDYANHMLRDQWTEEDVRDSLRKSEEYQQRKRPAGGG